VLEAELENDGLEVSDPKQARINSPIVSSYKAPHGRIFGNISSTAILVQSHSLDASSYIPKVQGMGSRDPPPPKKKKVLISKNPLEPQV
jgi:hypothetical protein